MRKVNYTDENRVSTRLVNKKKRKAVEMDVVKKGYLSIADWLRDAVDEKLARK